MLLVCRNAAWVLCEGKECVACFGGCLFCVLEIGTVREWKNKLRGLLLEFWVEWMSVWHLVFWNQGCLCWVFLRLPVYWATLLPCSTRRGSQDLLWVTAEWKVSLAFFCCLIRGKILLSCVLITVLHAFVPNALIHNQNVSTVFYRFSVWCHWVS